MRKLLLLGFIYLNSVNLSFSQSNYHLTLDDKMATKVDFEGAFAYSVNNVNYIIDLSISNGTYTERSESGTVLSTGTFERKGDKLFQLTTVDMFPDALIRGVLYFKPISRTSKDAHLELYSKPKGSEGELIISKVQ